jgi:hypothetical protein
VEASDSEVEYVDPEDPTYIPEEDLFTSMSFERTSSPGSMDGEPPETEDKSSSPPPSPTLKNLHTASTSSTTASKRDYTEQSTSTPHASPEKKRSRIQVASSTRVAFKISADDETKGKRPRGLLQYFQKGTKAHMSTYWAKQKELIGDQHETNKFNAEVNELQKKEDRRESARMRKQKQRARDKQSEIQTGVRSPGGRKRKVSARYTITNTGSPVHIVDY